MHKLNKIADVAGALKRSRKSYVPKSHDLRDLGAEVTGYFDHSTVPINILMFVDNDASPEVSSTVRNLFMTKSINVKLQISYFTSAMEVMDETADMAIIIGGNSDAGFEIARECREKLIPSCVVLGSDNPVDLKTSLLKSFDGDVFYLESIEKESVKKLKEQLGGWIAIVCASKKFAYSKAFPFVAGPIAKEIVHLTAIENAAVTAVPFVGGADFPIMLVNQMKMLAQIAAVYGVKLDYSLLKEAAGVMIVALFGKKCFKIIKKIVPGPRVIVAAPVTIVTTEAMGAALIAYFDAGGNAEGLLALVQKSAFGASVVKQATSPAVKTVTNAIKAKQVRKI